MMLFNGSKRKGIYFMEVPIFEDFTAIITPTPQNNNNCLMIHLRNGSQNPRRPIRRSLVVYDGFLSQIK